MNFNILQSVEITVEFLIDLNWSFLQSIEKLAFGREKWRERL